MAAKHTATRETPAARLSSDIDPGIAGRSPAGYACDAEALRRAYAQVPQDRNREARIRVLEGFPARFAIFSHQDFQQPFGGQARANMTWERRELAEPARSSPGQPQAGT